MRSGRLQRLSPLDVSNLRAEEHGMPMHVAALALLDGAPLRDAAGRLQLEKVRAVVEARLDLAPRLRQVLVRPRRVLGRPVWVDDGRFDIARHVRAHPVPGPGDEAVLLAQCAVLNERPLDRSRPLWELWLLPGLADGTIGMLIRLHHAVADGIAALALLGALLDPTPPAPATASPLWRPAPAPSGWQLFTGNLRVHAHALAAAVASLGHPEPVIERLGARVRQLRLLAGEGRAPRLSLNLPVGRRRRLLLARADLTRVQAIAHAHGATVNDVVLAAAAGGAGRLLAGRGELRPGLAVKASVATAARDPTDAAATGNRAAIMLVPLPVTEPHPGRRLVQISQAARERKRHPAYQPGGRFAQRWMVHAMSRQRLVNLFTSNLRGPPQSLYFAGAQILEIFQAGVVQGNVSIAVGALSYAGQLNLTIVGDADAVPDLQAFADGLTDTLDQLGGKRPRAER